MLHPTHVQLPFIRRYSRVMGTKLSVTQESDSWRTYTLSKHFLVDSQQGWGKKCPDLKQTKEKPGKAVLGAAPGLILRHIRSNMWLIMKACETHLNYSMVFMDTVSRTLLTCGIITSLTLTFLSERLKDSSRAGPSTDLYLAKPIKNMYHW